MNSVICTVNLSMIALLLPIDSPYLLPLTGLTLLFGYLVVLLMVLSDRRCIHVIVTESKYPLLLQLQTAIDHLATRIATLSAAEQRDLQYLLSMHDQVRASPTRVPALRDALHIVGSLALPTIAFFASVFAQSYLQVLIEDWLH